MQAPHLGAIPEVASESADRTDSASADAGGMDTTSTGMPSAGAGRPSPLQLPLGAGAEAEGPHQGGADMMSGVLPALGSADCFGDDYDEGLDSFMAEIMMSPRGALQHSRGAM